jgi:transcription antitermination factor NusG
MGRAKKRKLDIDESAIGAFDWYAVRATQVRRRIPEARTRTGETIPAHWVFVAQHRLEERGFITFLPGRGVHRFTNGYAVVRGQKDIRPTPIYPGWVFVGIEPGANRWRELQETPGVFAVFGWGGVPRPIPARAMTQMYAEHGAELKAEERERFMRSRKEFAPGAAATVVAGPFAGSLVQVIEVNDAQTRVLMRLFGADRQTTVETMMLEAA